MNRVEAFFSLVRAGLWETEPALPLFEGAGAEDWNAMYRMAVSQALIAVCFDGMNRLPAALRPPRPLYLQWAARTAQVENANRHLNQVLQQAVTLYRSHGLHPAVLKGQGAAACYSNPLHRQCGDIDIYIGRCGARIANRCIEEAGGVRTSEASYKHTCYEWDKADIENHALVGRLNSPLANRLFQQWVHEWYPDWVEERDGIPVAPSQFDALFIFIHAFEHFLNSGIGLRQLCDWARLLFAQRQQIDGSRLEKELQRIGLLKAARIFASLLVHHLGMPAEAVPFSLGGNSRLERVLLEEILATGNFGQYDRRIPPRPKGYWSGKWYTFTRALHRCRTLMEFAPSEACWYPLGLIYGTLVIQYKKLFH